MKHYIPLDLRISRIRSGLSNRDLSHLLGCNKERLSKLEHGKARISSWEMITLGLIYGQPIGGIFRQTSALIITGLKERISSLPDQPAHWSKHAQNRLDTINGLIFRLQKLTSTKHENTPCIDPLNSGQ